MLFCIPKILKNESNSQHKAKLKSSIRCCFVSQRYWKMKAIHNITSSNTFKLLVVLYPKDTEKWKQFTTLVMILMLMGQLFCIPKILKNESNSQLDRRKRHFNSCCFVSQRYWKMKAIHNEKTIESTPILVVLYPKDTEKWKQFTTIFSRWF